MPSAASELLRIITPVRCAYSLLQSGFLNHSPLIFSDPSPVLDHELFANADVACPRKPELHGCHGTAQHWAVLSPVYELSVYQLAIQSVLWISSISSTAWKCSPRAGTHRL